jgi:hypothetical protein
LRAREQHFRDRAGLRQPRSALVLDQPGAEVLRELALRGATMSPRDRTGSARLVVPWSSEDASGSSRAAAATGFRPSHIKSSCCLGTTGAGFVRQQDVLGRDCPLVRRRCSISAV